MDKKKKHVHSFKDFFNEKKVDQTPKNELANPEIYVCKTDEAKVEKINENNQGIKSSNLFEIVVGQDQEIPLWNKGVKLKWKFSNEFELIPNKIELMDYIRSLMSVALNKWGDSKPIEIIETNQNDYHFEVTYTEDNCTESGCTLARAFFPNEKQKLLILFHKLFDYSTDYQINVLIHELGHIFGLRHFFSQERETDWRSEIFGHHAPLTIMNYGELAKLTDMDRQDLKKLYSLVWEGELKEINGLPIKLYNS